jgi:uncharacterized membrane protein
VKLTLPEEVDYSKVVFNAYRTDPYQTFFLNKTPLSDKKSFLFEAKNFKPKEDFTIQVSWPKGIVDQSLYWQDFFMIHLLYILAGLITLASLIFIAIHWYFREIHKKGKGTIIPQYAPPENLRPAMAEVLLKEKVTDKGWSATVIDLAVRGHIKIKEDDAYWVDVVVRIILVIAIIFMFVFAIPVIFFAPIVNNYGSWLFSFFGFIIVLSVIFRISGYSFEALRTGNLKEIIVPKNYILEKIDTADRDILEDYEKKFLNILFRRSDIFSTKKMKWASNTQKRELYESMKDLEQSLYEEMTGDTGSFQVGVEKEKTGGTILAAAFFGIIFVLMFLKVELSEFTILISAIFLNSILLYVYLKYEAYLTEKGFILKEDWLGFKMYMETAERYRMQNLTPQTFEKYLPYAIIFGIERKWGKAFESFNIQNPSWYSGVYSSSGIHSGGFSQSGGFSPSGFSASFSSSFSSAFSSAGGAGSSGGGGGGAGGGGGGGGGGAS